MKKAVKCSGVFFDGAIGDGKPRIYITNHTRSRDAAAVLSALDKAKPCMLVSEKRYARDHHLRSIGRDRVITAAGGINTKWLHDSLRRLKGGESLLIFPDGESPHDGSSPPEQDSFNPSFVLLSLLSGAEIVPLYSAPGHTVFRCLNITAGTPIQPDCTSALTAEVLKKEGDRVRSALSALADA